MLFDLLLPLRVATIDVRPPTDPRERPESEVKGRARVSRAANYGPQAARWQPTGGQGETAYPALAALPGIEQLQAFLAGHAPAPPIARLTGRRIVAASVGSASYVLPASHWTAGPNGKVHSGVLAVVADGALIASVMSALPERVFSTTAELSMTFLGAPTPIGGDLTARGRLLHLDAEMGLADVEVRDAADRLVAQGTSRCSIFPAFDTSIELLPIRQAAGREQDRLDPYLRPFVTTQNHRRLEGWSGLDLLRAQLRGVLPRPPVDQLTGVRLEDADEGRATFALPASPWLRNEWGNVYGGVLTLVAMSAAAAAVQTTAAAGTGFVVRDVKINFLRAVPADGRATGDRNGAS